VREQELGDGEPDAGRTARDDRDFTKTEGVDLRRGVVERVCVGRVEHILREKKN
jgi:hypothetical protein